MEKISNDRELLLKDINETTSISGATIILVEKNMKEIRRRAKDNMRKLSLLL